mmetsp:Transcript_71215/g.122380  ORF Transcript_71215/g.122380 Transcript_71215/m.122380 type:complete len:247 (-) Transcript_71215:75-815(-)
MRRFPRKARVCHLRCFHTAQLPPTPSPFRCFTNRSPFVFAVSAQLPPTPSPFRCSTNRSPLFSLLSRSYRPPPSVPQHCSPPLCRNTTRRPCAATRRLSVPPPRPVSHSDAALQKPLLKYAPLSPQSPCVSPPLLSYSAATAHSIAFPLLHQPQPLRFRCFRAATTNSVAFPLLDQSQPFVFAASTQLPPVSPLALLPRVHHHCPTSNSSRSLAMSLSTITTTISSYRRLYRPRYRFGHHLRLDIN